MHEPYKDYLWFLHFGTPFALVENFMENQDTALSHNFTVTFIHSYSPYKREENGIISNSKLIYTNLFLNSFIFNNPLSLVTIL